MSIIDIRIICLILSIVFVSCQSPNDIINHRIGELSLEVYADRPPSAIPVFYDTLMDLNNDRIIEFIIEYYGPSGSGLKNRIKVYHYSEEGDSLFINEELSDLANPSFYFDSNIVCGYYIAAGGGSASKYRWNGNELILLEIYHVNKISEDSIRVTYKNLEEDAEVSSSIKEIDFELPEEYRYWNYIPLIKNK